MSETASATSTASAASSSAHGMGINQSNPAFKIVGICLAVGSGLFIGVSFVIKKKGLLASSAKSGNAAGEGHAYLKSWLWWTGMSLMIIGEILNFVAYAFTVAILVTAMGSISVVVAAILSHFILKETLTFFGWIGCTLCILGSIILALNAPPEQSVRTIKEFMKFFVSPGFLVWAGICIAASLVIVFYVAPRWGKKTMMPYISVCSLIGGISVSCTQGLGSAIITSIQGDSQIKHWFFWFLLVFVIVTLLVEINYLNKALELFNTSMVVPVYFCYFTSATMVTSFILYRGLKAPATSLITMVLGFLVTCLGITLLQLSKVDPEQLSGLDRKSTILLSASRQKTEADEKGNVTAMEEPGMDALRGGFGAVGSIIRARSISRRMSTASRTSSPGRYGFPSSDLNTHGMSHLQRYQLSDNPMPDDHSEHMETVPLSPASGPGSAQRRQTSLSFNNADVVHQYGYTKQDGKTNATHGIRLHDSPARRQFSSTSMDPVAEGDEHREKTIPRILSLSPINTSPGISSAIQQDHGSNLSSHGHLSPTPTLSTGHLSPTGSHHQAERKTSFSQLFKSATAGAGAGTSPAQTKYPKVKGEEEMEREERTALVADEEEDFGIYGSYMESPLMMDEGDGDLGERPSIKPVPAVPGGGGVSACESAAPSASATPSATRRPMGPR